MGPRIIRSAAERRLALLRVHEARSLSTTVQRLRALAADPSPAVRLWTARNANTPADALGTLLLDEHPNVQRIALFHPRISPEALERLARQEADEADVAGGGGASINRHYIAHHPNAAPELRAELLASGICPARPDDQCAESGVFPVRAGDGEPATPRRDTAAGTDSTWLSTLRALDEPGVLDQAVGLEFPRDFDLAPAQERFDQLAAGLSEAFGLRLAGGKGPQQDAAFFGTILIPAEVTHARDEPREAGFPIAVTVSNFGGLACCSAYRDRLDTGQGRIPSVHPADRGRIEQVLIDLEFRLVPSDVLDQPYEGPNQWVFGPGDATWGWRFFSYL